MKKNYFKIISVLIIIIITITSCKKDKNEENLKSTENADTIFAVNTTKSVKGEIKNYIELNGDVKTKTEVSIYPDVTGKLINIKKKLGDSVYKNEIIAYVDPSKPGMDFNASPVKSTITGTITDLPVKTGSTVTQQVVVAKVGKLDQLEIITYVAEKFISKIAVNLNAIIKTQAYPDEKFSAKIVEVSPVVDPVSRMLEVKIQVTSTNKKLLMPGMFTEIKIITEKKENIVKIPSECVIKRYGGYYVFIVNRTEENYGYVEKRKVKLGIQIADKTEILEGINSDEEVVYSGQSLLEDKSKVRIIDIFQPLTVEDIIE